jgi:hypothetical protein
MLDFMIVLLLDFGLTEVYVKKPECPTRKSGPKLKGGMNGHGGLEVDRLQIYMAFSKPPFIL